MKFTHEIIHKVWEKGKSTSYPNWKKDQCSAWIQWNKYGDRNSIYGWEIDHITPESKGGDNKLSNLRPLHWKNNLKTSNGRLSCPVKSSGNSNIGI